MTHVRFGSNHRACSPSNECARYKGDTEASPQCSTIMQHYAGLRSRRASATRFTRLRLPNVTAQSCTSVVPACIGPCNLLLDEWCVICICESPVTPKDAPAPRRGHTVLQPLLPFRIHLSEKRLLYRASPAIGLGYNPFPTLKQNIVRAILYRLTYGSSLRCRNNLSECHPKLFLLKARSRDSNRSEVRRRIPCQMVLFNHEPSAW